MPEPDTGVLPTAGKSDLARDHFATVTYLTISSTTLPQPTARWNQSKANCVLFSYKVVAYLTNNPCPGNLIEEEARLVRALCSAAHEVIPLKNPTNSHYHKDHWYGNAEIREVNHCVNMDRKLDRSHYTARSPAPSYELPSDHGQTSPVGVLVVMVLLTWQLSLTLHPMAEDSFGVPWGCSPASIPSSTTRRSGTATNGIEQTLCDCLSAPTRALQHNLNLGRLDTINAACRTADAF